MQLGRRLGADVPVFVYGHSAWAEGIGEKLQALELPPRWYLVLTPPCHAATAAIFGHPELTRDSLAIRIPRFPFSGTRNDCQAVATRLHPEIREALEWLESRAEPGFAPRMSGTGSSVFASYASREAAESVLAQCPAQLRAFVAAGCNRSPLYRTPGNEVQNYWGVAKR
jgi:4-diphosphocytidyl-2-C-methyl-D-erythritol kinase